MTFVLGSAETREGAEEYPATHLGSYRALDGSAGAQLYLDLDGPHALLVVGKRGYGKSYTLGVIAEGLARTAGVAPVVVDPVGVFDTLASSADGESVPATIRENPTVAPGSLDPRSWCSILDISPESEVGSLVWQAASARGTVAGMYKHVVDADAPAGDRRAARNHLSLAESWGVFDSDGLDATTLGSGDVTVLDISGLNRAAMNAVVRSVAEGLYQACLEERLSRLPWLLVDEAHAFFDGVAGPALDRLLTRGRAPGVSFVAATQRPGVVPEVAVSQSDILVSHRLTAGDDLAALERAQPTYMESTLAERMPTEPGEVLVIDDATETVHAARVRRRDTPHGGESPSVSTMRGDTANSV